MTTHRFIVNQRKLKKLPPRNDLSSYMGVRVAHNRKVRICIHKILITDYLQSDYFNTFILTITQGLL